MKKGESANMPARVPFLRRLLARMSDVLSQPRPPRFLRRFQAFLILLTLLLIVGVTTFPVWNEPRPDLSTGGPFEEGKIAQETVLARVPFEVPRLDLYEQAKLDAMASVPLHFERNMATLTSAEEKSLNSLFQADTTALKTCREKSKTEPAFLACARAIPGFSGVRDLRVLVYQGPDKLAPRAVDISRILLENLVLVQKIPQESDESTAETIEVFDALASSPPKTMPREALVAFSELGKEKGREVTASLLKPAIPDNVLRASYLEWVLPHFAKSAPCRFLPEEMARAKREAAARVRIEQQPYEEGSAIIRSGDVIQKKDKLALEVHSRQHLKEILKRVLAMSMQHLFLIMILVYFAYRFERRRISDVTANLIFFLTVWLFCGTLFGMQSIWQTNGTEGENQIFGSWVPIGIFAVLLSILFSELFALASVVYLSLLVFAVSQYDAQSFLHSFILSMVGVWSGVRIRKRIHFLSTSLLMAVLAGLLLTAGFLYENRLIVMQSGGDIFSPAYKSALGVAVTMGIVTAFSIVLLPIFESLFNVPTRFRLQELADPSTPLLQEMTRLAPSTWTHTLMVASLAEKACERLGLNTMLARTGVYYHDIGKMRNAGYFVENQHLIPKPENIDKDNPEAAARVIIDHVLDGLKMAREIRLPKEVMAFIPEHHGTSTMSFFYHKALEKSRRKVNRDKFRYPGPIPQSRETGIVMIADSLEAASRSLEEINEDSVDALVQKIINLKLAENQLDESGLTLGDLNVVRKAFTDVLLSSLHQRPKYPAAEDTRKLEARRRK
jgi:putative nucleotidyltransferase with HDIG domain